MQFKLKEWIKNPYNLGFLALLIFTVYLRFRYLFVESIWVDETAYYLQAKYLLETFTFGGATPFADMRIMPELVIAFWGLFFELFTAGRLMALTYTIIAIVFTYLIGKEMKNELVGLIAAALVGFNPQIWFHSSRTLIDSPLMAMYVMSAYFLIRLEKEYSIKNALLLLMALLFTLETKYVGVIFVFAMIFYYIIRLAVVEKNRKELMLKLAHSKEAYFILVITLAALFAARKWILDGLTLLQYNNFFITQISTMLSSYIAWLALAGMIFAVAYKKKASLVVMSWSLIYYLAFTFHPANNDPRYILPAFPAMILLAAYGLIESGDLIMSITKYNHARIRTIVSIILAAILLISIVPANYTEANHLLLRLSYPFTGYNEAGQWIEKNAESGAELFVMSTAWANLFSNNIDRRFKTINTAMFTTPESYVQYTKNITAPVYLIIDQWEAGAQPRWMAPSQESVDMITKMGYNLENVIFRKYPQTEEQFNAIYNQINLFDLEIKDTYLQKIPAVFIFKRQ
jgi:hypothetical protein